MLWNIIIYVFGVFFFRSPILKNIHKHRKVAKRAGPTLGSGGEMTSDGTELDRWYIRTQARASVVESQVESFLAFAPVAAGRINALAVLARASSVRTLVDICNVIEQS